MPTLKQIYFASMVIFALLATATGQDSATAQRSSLTITASASGERVRITAPSSVVQMHVEVYAASGEKVFDQEVRGGNVFDWHLQDGQAQRLAPGTYVCVVTAKTISGKLTQRIGSVNVEEKSVSVQAADSRQLSAAQAQPIGPVEENPSWTIAAKDEPQTPTVIANDGTDGQMIRGRGALTFRLGNFFSGIDTEQMRLTEAGNLGIGTSEPKAKLEVAGTIRAERFLVVKPGQTSNAAGNPGQTTDDAGSVQPLVAGTGTQNQIAKWIDNSATLGNSGITETATGVGIGTAAPTQALDVANGRIVTTGSQTLAGAFDSMLEVKSTITNNGLAQSAIKARNLFNGSGDFVTGLDVAPTFAPSASINTAQGFVAGAFFAPPPGVTITNANGGASATVYSNTTGAVTNGAAFNIVSPFLFGSLKPTNQYGLRIGNQGISGTANSYGLFVDAQSGSTNSFSAIFAGGNVGIGTTSPAAKLDVAGDINTSTQYNLGGNRVLAVAGTENTFVGVNAGVANTGLDNSFFGSSAGAANTGGGNNSFFGRKAGEKSTGGGQNSFFGASAGVLNTMGSSNSFFGADAGHFNNMGGVNTFLGVQAGVNNDSGSSNTFVGFGAGRSNSNGNKNVGIGVEANIGGPGLSNATAIGADAQVDQSNALVLGSVAGFNNATTSVNVGIGTTTPQATLDVNGAALFRGGATVTGTNGDGVVLTARRATGDPFVVIDATTVAQNSVLAFRKNNFNRWLMYADNGTESGGNAGSDFKLDAYNNAGGIANFLFVKRATGAVGIGTTSPFVNTKLDIVGGFLRLDQLAGGGDEPLCRNSAVHTIATCNASSMRYKESVQPLRQGLHLIQRLRPVTFNWKEGGRPDLGLIAEEVAKVEPLLTFKNDKGEIEGVKYDHLNVILISAIKEQQEQIMQQQTAARQQQVQITALRTANNLLNSRLRVIERTLKNKHGLIR